MNLRSGLTIISRKRTEVLDGHPPAISGDSCKIVNEEHTQRTQKKHGMITDQSVHITYCQCRQRAIQRTNSFSGSTLIVLDSCGHFPFVEAPKSLFVVLEDFLTKAAKRSIPVRRFFHIKPQEESCCNVRPIYCRFHPPFSFKRKSIGIRKSGLDLSERSLRLRSLTFSSMGSFSY